MKIVDNMKMKENIPTFKLNEDVRKRRIDVVSNEKYEDLENLTNKSIEFYNQVSGNKHHSSLEKSERINREIHKKNMIVNDLRMRNSKSSLTKNKKSDLKKQHFQAVQPPVNINKFSMSRYNMFNTKDVSYAISNICSQCMKV
jgi:hypothetical protein